MPYTVAHDSEKCDGCLSCVSACAEAHEGVANCWVVKVGDKFAYFSCMQCKKPQCEAACPTGAIRREDGVVLLVREICVGCVNCVYACPWGFPQFNPATGKVNKCDLCKERVAAGEKPHCVAACPNQALAVKEVKPPAKKPAKKPAAKKAASGKEG
ncbi:4Fe-4S dicluster domain-containing protein [Thermosulfurimonas sp. F29]|uniref:4Fe-4S dicluster domain-containing protein n=1 Tax=Thermosulfurimonas sp. F29 TaxID=2867247 RepID=UPI001C83BB1C|nr:4Fe-4S dicluster domain-containing protein [Thermosulfurimonas sp. F29]MBX6423095.1 4Fe-4S ferredoxin [Thermosulfurimonas sp. F29]